MKNRIEAKLQELTERGEKAFVTYVTAGLPDMERTKEILRAEERGGLDIAELGVPFSDPVADGPVIQDASYEAILNGATIEKTFTLVKELRAEGRNLPIVFMLYSNTIFHYGIEDFVEQCRVCGVDGLIVPDLPLEEQESLQEALSGSEETILLQLVSPVSGDRIPRIVNGARGFIYCVSSMGVTGGNAEFHREILNYLAAVKNAAKIPVFMGFGIRTANDVAPMKDTIDGAIVGSHFISLLRDHDFDPAAAEEYIRTFKKELNQL